jgi:hypothetical protein
MQIGLKDYWKDNKHNSLRWKIKNLRWELRYAWRRAWYGYDDMDIIEMNTTFIERYKAILKDYRKSHMGLFNVPEEYRDVYNKLFFDEEETDAIIDTMIFHLEMMDEDYVEKKLYGKNVYDDDYKISEYTLERNKRIFSVMNQNKEAFMKLFNIFFWDLWD